MKTVIQYRRIPEYQKEKIEKKIAENPSGRLSPLLTDFDTLRYSKKKKWFGKLDNEIRPDPRGGTTEAFIYNENGDLLASSLALCSLRDTFSYRIGREIAIGRALKMLEEESAN